MVAGTGPAHVGTEDDEVTLGETPASAGRAGRTPQQSAVRNADDI